MSITVLYQLMITLGQVWSGFPEDELQVFAVLIPFTEEIAFQSVNTSFYSHASSLWTTLDHLLDNVAHCVVLREKVRQCLT